MRDAAGLGDGYPGLVYGEGGAGPSAGSFSCTRTANAELSNLAYVGFLCQRCCWIRIEAMKRGSG